MFEKRKNMRRFAAVNVSYKVEGLPTGGESLIVNVSKGGVGMESKINLPVGERLTLFFPNYGGKSVLVDGKILHSSKGNFATHYGVRFNENDIRKAAMFNKYLLHNFNLH